MKIKPLFNLSSCLILVLALVAGTALLARQTAAQEPSPQAPAVPDETLGSFFTYQGRLEDASGPVNDTCDFEFSLWTDSLLGNPVGGTQARDSVTLDDGYFSVSLDFGVSAFQGEARYLQIAVDCGSGSTTLSPRVALGAAPYAHSLRPGAVVSGSVVAGSVLEVENSYAGMLYSYGIHGTSLDVGVVGSGGNVGVKGESASSSGYGVYGYNDADVYGCGVYGQVGEASGKVTFLVGAGVWGDSADSPGLYGTSNNSAGVFGWSTSNVGTAGLSDSEDGVQGTSNSGSGVAGVSSSGSGVYGRAVLTGVVGIATGSSLSPTPAGVYGEALSDGNGVHGESYGLYGSYAGVYGRGVYTASGVYGSSAYGNGLHGYSQHGNGVSAVTVSGDSADAAVRALAYGWSYGVSASNPASGVGVRGTSYDGVGVEGESTNSEGVYGMSSNSHGVHGYSASSGGNWAGVFGHGTSGPGLMGLSTSGNLIELYNDFALSERRFYVDTFGAVYADNAYHCGLGSGYDEEPGVCIFQDSEADFAEMLPADEGLEPGDVLVVSLDGTLARSTQAYQPTVVGVYSARPGYLGGGEYLGREDYAPLAVVGIVPVKASAENGPIAPGDMLVASSIPGHAMSAGPNPPTGTVIGKALEGLEGDTGMIKLLVVLQ
jgi:hypothetical protein